MALRALFEPGAWPSCSNNLIYLSVLLPARRKAITSLAIGSWLAGWVLIAAPGPISGVLHSGLFVCVVAITVMQRAPAHMRRSGEAEPTRPAPLRRLTSPT